MSQDGDDVIHGGADFDRIYGDEISGPGAQPGNDQLFGEGGDDPIFGGVGAGTLFGGDDLDELHGGEDADTLDGGAGRFTAGSAMTACFPAAVLATTFTASLARIS